MGTPTANRSGPARIPYFSAESEETCEDRRERRSPGRAASAAAFLLVAAARRDVLDACVLRRRGRRRDEDPRLLAPHARPVVAGVAHLLVDPVEVVVDARVDPARVVAVGGVVAV